MSNENKFPLKDKIGLGFTTLHDSRRYAQFRDAWIPHTQTQRYG